VPNLAKFTIEGTASSPGGYDATVGQTLHFALEGGPASLVNRWTLQVYDPADLTSPLASYGAPTLSLVGATTGQKVDAVTPGTQITCVAPSGMNTWIVRSIVNGGILPNGKKSPDYVWERMLAVRDGSGRRRIVGTEQTQYGPEGWARAVNEMLATAAPSLPNGTAVAQTSAWNGASWAKVAARSYDVSLFGAAGDGATDDTTAINSAIAAAQAAGGGTVLLMANHRITAALTTITVNNVIIKGRGKGFLAGTQLYIDGALPSCTPFVFSGCQYSGIEDIYARAGKVFTAECSLVLFNNTYACFVRRCRVDQHWGAVKIVSANGTILEELETASLYGLYGVLFIGSALQSSEGAEVRNCYFTGSHPFPFPGTVVGNGPWAATTAYTQGQFRTNAGFLWQCSVSGTSAGSGGPSAMPAGDPGTMFATDVVDGTAKWRFIAPTTQAHVVQDSNAHSLRLFNTAFVNGVFPFVLRNALAIAAPHFLFARNIETDHCWEAFVLTEGGEISVRDASMGATLFGPVVRVDSGIVLDCHFCNVKAFGGAKHGFDIGAAVKLDNCQIGNNGQLTANTYDGINIGSNVSGFQVRGHKSLNGGSQQRRGLTVNNGTSDNYTISDNDFTGNVTGGLYDGGSGANKTVHDNRPDPWRIDLGAQSANIGATNIFPVNPGAGAYQVDVIVELLGNGAATGTGLVVTLGYTDGLGATTQATSALPLTTSGRTRQSFIVYSAGGANVTYAVSGITAANGMLYTLRIITRGPLAR
jgi:hypothetical protein